MTYSVAVLGANGFIGSRMVELAHLGGLASVRPIVRRAAALASASRFELEGRVADARDAQALACAFEGCDHVVHAVAGDPQTIVGAIEPVYRAAEAAGVRRLVYLSSASVHGQSPAPGTDETSALSDKQTIEYNVAKIQAERLLAELRSSGNVEVVVLRPGIVFGPRSSWTGGFADELLAGTAYLVEGGQGICNSVYVDNVVHAIRLALEAPDADGRTYLVCDGEEVTWADLCRPVAQALGFNLTAIAVAAPSSFRLGWRQRLRNSGVLRQMASNLPEPINVGLKAGYAKWRQKNAGLAPGPRIEITEERTLLHRCRTKLSSTRAERELGYQPIVSFEEACRRCVGWLAFAGYPTVQARAPVQ
jgi:nucleoside-diphosphate-sugar epimerase